MKLPELYGATAEADQTLKPRRRMVIWGRDVVGYRVRPANDRGLNADGPEAPRTLDDLKGAALLAYATPADSRAGWGG